MKVSRDFRTFSQWFVIIPNFDLICPWMIETNKCTCPPEAQTADIVYGEAIAQEQVETKK